MLWAYNYPWYISEAGFLWSLRDTDKLDDQIRICRCLECTRRLLHMGLAVTYNDCFQDKNAVESLKLLQENGRRMKSTLHKSSTVNFRQDWKGSPVNPRGQEQIGLWLRTWRKTTCTNFLNYRTSRTKIKS